MGQQPKQLTPHQSPQHYWGAELRAWREKRGLSVAALGKQLHLNGSYISKFERGERTPRRELAEDCDRVLSAGGSLLRLHTLVVEARGQHVVNPPSSGDHVASFAGDVANHVDSVATIIDQPAPLEPGDDITVPARTSDGRIIYVQVSRRLFLQGIATAAISTALPQAEPASQIWSDDPWSFARTITTAWPDLRLSRADATYGADWNAILPGGRSMLGSQVDIQIYPTSTKNGRIIAGIPDQRRAQDFVRRPGRGLLIGARPGNDTMRLYALDARSVRQRVAGGAGELVVPDAYELDDLTYGILWAVANLDDALQADDQELTEARNDLSAYERLSASAVSREAAPGLNAVAHMWLGSDFCARHILRTLPDLPEIPAFWTREQAGEEASTWLLFDHKYLYLKETMALLRTASARAFCIPESAVRSSPRRERVLLFLAVALMESLGIHAQLTPDPAYSNVEGFVVAPNKQAIIANWVRGDGMWHVDTTSRTPVIREFTEVTADVSAHSLIEAPTAQARLRALADYLGLDWSWLRGRCAALALCGTSGLIRARSRLVSAAGLDAACAFVGAFPDS